MDFPNYPPNTIPPPPNTCILIHTTRFTRYINHTHVSLKTAATTQFKQEARVTSHIPRLTSPRQLMHTS